MNLLSREALVYIIRLRTHNIIEREKELQDKHDVTLDAHFHYCSLRCMRLATSCNGTLCQGHCRPNSQSQSYSSL